MSLTACDTDDFDRSDSATTMGSTTQGRAWTPYATSGSAPTLGISSNQGYFVTSAVGGKALIDPGIPDVEITVTLAVLGGDQSKGVAVRHHDSDSRCYTVSANKSIDRLAVTKVTATGGIPVDFTHDWIDGDELKVRTEGDTLTVWVNGTLVGTVTMDSAYAAFTRVGLYEDQTTDARFDDFEVCPLAVTKPWGAGWMRS